MEINASTIPNVVPIRRALLSVYDKTGIVELATVLSQQYGEHLLSTGGTASLLQQAGLPVQDVSDYTGAPECLHGRVKTLHPKVHGGLLAVRDNATHQRECQELGSEPIDMTIVNLYPFVQAVAQPNVTYEQVIENIDIGGPSMLRSTAKNLAYTTIVTSPAQYSSILQELEANQGGVTLACKNMIKFGILLFLLAVRASSAIFEPIMERLTLCTCYTTKKALGRRSLCDSDKYTTEYTSLTTYRPSSLPVLFTLR